MPKDFGHEPDDHIGLELDFMHKLCEMTQEKAENADEAGLVEILKGQKVFLDEHLLRWVSDWTKDVVESAETDFYKGMAQLLDASSIKGARVFPKKKPGRRSDGLGNEGGYLRNLFSE